LAPPGPPATGRFSPVRQLGVAAPLCPQAIWRRAARRA